MFGQVGSLHSFYALRTWFRAPAVFLALFLALAMPVATPAADTPSGLPLPRFVTTRSNPINVRVGPGTKYAVAWVYLKAGVPVEIIQEFDTWRKIRDVDGSEGWLHQNLLQGKRAGLVAPWLADDQRVALFTDPDDKANVRAWLGPKFRVDLKSCDGRWCRVIAATHPATGSAQSYEGWMQQDGLWGVYKDESFD